MDAEASSHGRVYGALKKSNLTSTLADFTVYSFSSELFARPRHSTHSIREIPFLYGAKNDRTKIRAIQTGKRRSLPSMASRNTVHPVHKKARVLPGGLSTRNDFQKC